MMALDEAFLYCVDWQPKMLQFKVLHNFTEESFIWISSENLWSTVMLTDLQEPKNIFLFILGSCIR